MSDVKKKKLIGGAAVREENGGGCHGEILVKVTAQRHRPTEGLSFHHKILEYFLPQCLIPTPTDCLLLCSKSRFQLKVCKTQTLPKEEYLGKPQVKKGEKHEDVGEMRSLFHPLL
jgi:hypothetical protein